MRWSQIRRRKEVYMNEIILRFDINSEKKKSWYSIHIRIFKQIAKYLTIGL
jgi:hypothetical protein